MWRQVGTVGGSSDEATAAAPTVPTVITIIVTGYDKNVVNQHLENSVGAIDIRGLRSLNPRTQSTKALAGSGRRIISPGCNRMFEHFIIQAEFQARAIAFDPEQVLRIKSEWFGEYL